MKKYNENLKLYEVSKEQFNFISNIFGGYIFRKISDDKYYLKANKDQQQLIDKIV